MAGRTSLAVVCLKLWLELPNHSSALAAACGYPYPESGATRQASGDYFDHILGNIKVDEVGEVWIGCQGIRTWSPGIRMLGLQDCFDGLSGLVIGVIRVEDAPILPFCEVPYGTSQVTAENLLVEGLCLLFWSYISVLIRKVRLHGS
jgi:hypothetical protein